MILLKDGWKYNQCDGELGDLLVSSRDRFNCPQFLAFHSRPSAGGSRVIPENIKKELKGDLPSEITYALFSTITGLTFGGTPVSSPLCFLGAYVHIPTDWTSKVNQLILVYLLLWNIREEKAHNYTKGKIGFKKEVREDE